MIYLRFSEREGEQIKFAIINEPAWDQELKEIFEKEYSKGIAKKYLREFSEILDNEIGFPEEINYLNSTSNTFFKYSAKEGKWKDTHKGISDYTVLHDSEYWEGFIEKHRHYKKLLPVLKEAVERVTSTVLVPSEESFEPIRSIKKYVDSESYNNDCEDVQNNILWNLKQYFSEGIVEEVYDRILDRLFKNDGREDYIVIFEEDSIIGKLDKSGFKALEMEGFERVYAMLQYELDEQDLAKFMIRIKNLFIFGNGNIKIPIKKKDYHENYYIEVENGKTAIINRGSIFLKLDKDILNEIAKVLDNELKINNSGELELKDENNHKSILKFDDYRGKINLYLEKYEIIFELSCKMCDKSREYNKPSKRVESCVYSLGCQYNNKNFEVYKYYYIDEISKQDTLKNSWLEVEIVR